mmetsp:Transcript_12782/g.13811  ORF Transcript_12782/g.13811 Transcript_12782/m.13811 type:complete len:121 (+) Transcript_12782:3361-3723(+)
MKIVFCFGYDLISKRPQKRWNVGLGTPASGKKGNNLEEKLFLLQSFVFQLFVNRVSSLGKKLVARNQSWKTGIIETNQNHRKNLKEKMSTSTISSNENQDHHDHGHDHKHSGEDSTLTYS